MEVHREYYLKIADYCNYQERCTHEVVAKLQLLDAEPELITPILTKLKEENLLNDHRFAHSFARGKFRFKKWGKMKIKYHLKQKQLPEADIASALVALDEEGYTNILIDLLNKKITTENFKNTLTDKAKLYRYAIAKGYENDLVQQALHSLWKK